MLQLVTVYCQRDDCIYLRDGKCSNTGINIDSDGNCIEYIEEKLSPLENPDFEQDIKE